jgi:hypothetical protein
VEEARENLVEAVEGFLEVASQSEIRRRLKSEPSTPKISRPLPARRRRKQTHPSQTRRLALSSEAGPLCYFLTLRLLRSNDTVNPYTLIPVSLTAAGYDVTIAPTSNAKSGNPGADVIYTRYYRKQLFQHSGRLCDEKVPILIVADSSDVIL